MEQSNNYNNGSCSRPRRINGTTVRCWTNDFSQCASCANLNNLYTKKLIGSGFENNDKNKYYFLTLTAPSFGTIHSVPYSVTDAMTVCACGVTHEFGSDLAGVPVDAKKYKFGATVRWNNGSAELFRRSMRYLGEELPGFSWAAVREYQSRGSLHFHIIIRVSNDSSAVEVVEKLEKVSKYKSHDLSWGRNVDARLLANTQENEQTVRYMSKVVGYAGKKTTNLSPEQKAFYKKLDAASVKEKFSNRLVKGFGYGGYLFTKSASWSNLTREELKQETRTFAAANKVEKLDKTSDENSKQLRVLAERLGNDEDYAPSESYAEQLRKRLGLSTHVE